MITTDLNTQIQEAWIAALTEYVALNPVGEGSMIPNLIDVIRQVRTHHLTREAKNETFRSKVYEDIRNIPAFYTLFMSAATTFNLALPDQYAAIEFFSQRCEVYKVSSNVVDNGVLGSKAPPEALTTILKENPWLFMLLYASTQERITVATLASNGYKGSTK